MVTTSIEGNLSTLQETQQKLQVNSLGGVIEKMVEDVKQATAKCTIEVVVIQVELGCLRTKISAPPK